MLHLLSHPYNDQMVGWKGNFTYEIKPINQIGVNSHANTFKLSVHNHSGTHYDAPLHFNPNGLAIAQLPLDRFVFTAPSLLNIPKDLDELFQPLDFEPYLHAIKQCDLLLLRTGQESLRTASPFDYQQHGAGFSVQAAQYLVEQAPNLRAIGMDCLSASAFQHHKEGIAAHQVFLGNHRADGGYTCLIEDMKLSCADGVQHVTCAPILVEGMDSAPVTVIAECEVQYAK